MTDFEQQFAAAFEQVFGYAPTDVVTEDRAVFGKNANGEDFSVFPLDGEWHAHCYDLAGTWSRYATGATMVDALRNLGK